MSQVTSIMLMGPVHLDGFFRLSDEHSQTIVKAANLSLWYESGHRDKTLCSCGFRTSRKSRPSQGSGSIFPGRIMTVYGIENDGNTKRP